MNNRRVWMSLVIGLALVAACARPQPPESGPKSGPKVEYKDLKPEVYPVPEEVKQALPGLQNDNIYIYREVSPTINLVANLPQYSLPEAIRRTAQALVALTRDPRFRAGIDFWIIQTQPEPDKGPEVLVWGVRPAEALAYAQQGDLTRFFTDSEYVLVNDKIIPAGPERAAFLK